MVAVTILPLLCASLHSLRPLEGWQPGDKIIARSILLSFHHLSVAIPTCAGGGGPRHLLFIKTRYHTHFLTSSEFQQRGTNIGLLLSLLRRDVELNPGPFDDEVKCVCSSSKDPGQCYNASTAYTGYILNALICYRLLQKHTLIHVHVPFVFRKCTLHSVQLEI